MSGTRWRVLALLAVISLVATTGCIGLFSAGPSPDVTVENDLNETVSVDLTVVQNSTDEVLIDESLTLKPNQSVNFQDPLPTNGEFQVSVSTSNGLERADGYLGGGDPENLFISIEKDRIDFLAGVA